MRRPFTMVRVWVAIFATAVLITPSPSVATPGFDAHEEAVPARYLPDNLLPYNGSFARPLPTGDNYDEEGVVMKWVDGTLHNHPVAQAQYVLSLLSSYLHNQDAEYLAIARANADRLIDTAVRSRGALYFPYPFDFALHGGADVMEAPWYSAMAQGQALSAFVRLYRVTGDDRYKTAADDAFTSFENLRQSGVPWTINVDDEDYAWFEEYADDEHPDFTFNGHGFAVYGLYDYYQLTQDPGALQLFRMGIATMKRYAEDIRVPGWISHYCLTHGTPSVSYHNVHTEMLYKVYSMTGDTYFATVADAFVEDHPNPTDYGTGRFASGTYTARKFNSRGAITETKQITLAILEKAAVGSRAKIQTQPGNWLRVDSGSLAGYWVQENPGSAHIIGLALQRFTFEPARLLRFAKGVYTGYTYAKNGDVLTTKRAGLNADSAAFTDMRALINGRVHYRITGGIWKDMWVPAESRLSFKGSPLHGG